jgi:hypothetical protein
MIMPVTPGLDELRGQARRTYRYWPIYLMLRLREVEQHLTPTQIDELGPVVGFDPLASASLPARIPSDGRLALLVEYGLLTDDVYPLDLPVNALPLPAADDYLFRTGVSLINGQWNSSCVSLDFVAHQANTLLRIELLRTATSCSELVTTIVEVFTRISIDLSADVAFDAARYYALIHGARVLDWQPVPAHLAAQFLPEVHSTNGTEPVLPRRRRGRGHFRTPN